MKVIYTNYGYIIIHANLEFIKNYLDTTDNIILKPFVKNKIAIKNNTNNIVYVNSKQIIPFKHNYYIDNFIENSLSIEKIINSKLDFNSEYLLLGELNDITNSRRIKRIFLTDDNELYTRKNNFHRICGLKIEHKKTNEYNLTLTYPFYVTDDEIINGYHDIPFLTVTNNSIESAIEDLDGILGEYGTDDIINSFISI